MLRGEEPENKSSAVSHPTSDLNSAILGLSKNAQKREKKRLAYVQKREERARELEENERKRKEQRAKFFAENGPPPEQGEKIRTDMQEQRKKKREETISKFNELLDRANYTVCVDLNYNALMNEKEVKSLVCQIQTLHGIAKMAEFPYRLCVAGVPPLETSSSSASPSFSLTSFLRQLAGYANWLGYEECPSRVEERFRDKLGSVVYLSPDATEILEKAQPDVIYVIGGLVDGTRIKGASFERAKQLGVQCRRLPVKENVKCLRDYVLNVNDVGRLLTLHRKYGEWGAVFKAFVESENTRRFRLRNENDEEEDDNEQEEQEQGNGESFSEKSASEKNKRQKTEKDPIVKKIYK